MINEPTSEEGLLNERSCLVPDFGVFICLTGKIWVTLCCTT
jgi:hypothetical protein